MFSICKEREKNLVKNKFTSLQKCAGFITSNGDVRTVLVVVGDARNNFKYEALREFYEISMKTAQTIWINPEHEGSWNSGDSIIEHYAASCDYTLHIAEAQDLVQLFETQLIEPLKKHRRYIVFNDFSQKFRLAKTTTISKIPITNG